MLNLAFGLLLSASAGAAELAGVVHPDTASVGGKTLQLNGQGLREKVVIDVYVGALYLPAKTTSSVKAINDDVPKRLVMTFIYNTVDAGKLKGAFEEGLAANADAGPVQDRFERLYGWLPTVYSGDEITFDYVPGSGTTMQVNGATKGTIEGADFMKALWAVYLGPKPPTGNFKKGLLGG